MGWIDRYRCEWGIVVGERIRRLRKSRGLTLVQLARLVEKPGGGEYSAGYFSRIERGWASAPLWVYIAIAAALEIEPWRLLGPGEVEREVTEAEHVLLSAIKKAGLAPTDALARLLGVAAPVLEGE